MSSCEVSEIFKNTFFYRTPPVTALVFDHSAEVLLSMNKTQRRIQDPHTTPSQRYRKERFAKIVKDFQSLIDFPKLSILDFCRGPVSKVCWVCRVRRWSNDKISNNFYIVEDHIKTTNFHNQCIMLTNTKQQNIQLQNNTATIKINSK